MQGEYRSALKLTDQAVARLPRDAVLHEFRSLVLFAPKRYPESAAAIHAVLAVGPGWEPPDPIHALSRHRHLHSRCALEAACKKNVKARPALLGITTSPWGTRRMQRQFRRAAELQPKDSVSPSLVANAHRPTSSPRRKAAGPAPKPVPSDQRVGNWAAAGKRTEKYAMNLRKDGTFNWAYNRGSRKQEVKGVYTVEGNVLAMEPDSGGVMVAELTVKDDTLQFKMVGSKPKDPPLEFRRGSSN